MCFFHPPNPKSDFFPRKSTKKKILALASIDMRQKYRLDIHVSINWQNSGRGKLITVCSSNLAQSISNIIFMAEYGVKRLPDRS